MREGIWDVKTRRKIFLDFALKQAKPGTGSEKQFLRKRTVTMKWIDFSPILGRMKWAVIGAGATRLYIAERKPMDIDIIIQNSDAKKARLKLAASGFTYNGDLKQSAILSKKKTNKNSFELGSSPSPLGRGDRGEGDIGSISGSTWIAPNRKAVDVIEAEYPWLEDALLQAKQNKDKQGLPILPFPYLVLLKYQAGRTIDLGDIARMLGQANEQMLDSTKQLFQIYEPTSLDDLENLIYLGKLELQ